MREVLSVINRAVHADPPAADGIALIVDDARVLQGIVTDGDIRRFLIAGGDLESPVAGAMNRKPFTLSSVLSADEMLVALLQETKRRSLPGTAFTKIVIVNEDGTVHDVVTFFELWRRTDVKTRTVGIVGLGYVGLTLALTFAEMGLRVVGVDVDERVVGELHSGRAHFYERGLQEMLLKHLNKNFTVQRAFAGSESDVYVVCVGTPVSGDTLVTAPLASSLAAVARVLKRHDLVVLRSTVPAGTTREIGIPALEAGSGLTAGKDFFVAFAPERTVEGKAMEELRTLPQVVGGYDEASRELAGKLFHLIAPVIVPVASLEAAEMVKLLNNTYRDLVFSYANEIAMLCHAYGLSAHEVIRAANHGYVRDPIPLPSPGVGGPCLTKDPYLLHITAAKKRVPMELSLKSRAIHRNTIDHLCGRVEQFLAGVAGRGERPEIFVAGLAFKGEPETSDLRGSSALEIIERLAPQYAVRVYDPVVKGEEIEIPGAMPVSFEEGFKGAHVALILNNHRSFRAHALKDLACGMARPGLFFDAWYLYGRDRGTLPEGITYATL